MVAVVDIYRSCIDVLLPDSIWRDLWFGRELRIDGPYSFYVTVMRYAIPMTSVIIPRLSKSL